MRSSFLVSVDVIEFRTVKAYTSLGLTSVMYSMNKYVNSIIIRVTEESHFYKYSKEHLFS